MFVKKIGTESAFTRVCASFHMQISVHERYYEIFQCSDFCVIKRQTILIGSFNQDVTVKEESLNQTNNSIGLQVLFL